MKFAFNQPQGLLSRGVLGLCLMTALQGCTPLVLGGMATGVMMAADRRTSGTQVEDEGIELRVMARAKELLGDKAHINAVSYNRQVLLTGEVPTEQDKEHLEQLISKIENVQSVINELGVLGASSFTQRSADAIITGRVKTALIDAKDISTNNVKVITERGVVYLLGRVTEHEAAIATQVARTTIGVQRVVRVFEVISTDELKRIQAPVLSPQAAPINGSGA